MFTVFLIKLLPHCFDFEGVGRREGKKFPPKKTRKRRLSRGTDRVRVCLVHTKIKSLIKIENLKKKIISLRV